MKTIKMIKLNYLIKRLLVFFTNLVLFILFFLIGDALAPWLEVGLDWFFIKQATANNLSALSRAEIIWLEVAEASPLFIAVIFLFILNSIFLVKYRKTLGQKLFALDLVKTNNELPSLFSIIVLRNIIFILSVFIPAGIMLIIGLVIYPDDPNHFIAWRVSFPLFTTSIIDYLFIFRKDRRCLHDLIAGTKVVEKI